MILIALTGVLVLVVGGCVCVVWAARRGPPWVRAVARATLLGGEAVRKSGRRSGSRGGGDDGGGGGE